MGAAAYSSSSYLDQPPIGRRALAFALAVAANVLLFVMLLTLAPLIDPPRREPRAPVVVQLLPEPEPPARDRTASPTKRNAGSAAPKAPAPKPAPAPAPEGPPPPLQMMIVTREVFAASDIGRLPGRRRSPDDGAAIGSGQGDTGDDGPGRGPGGERLYNAEWQRRPTNAELGFYLREGRPRTGSALIACRTVAGFRVEDCVQIGESPQGSGYGRSVLAAAWQFRVRPPRIGGKAMIGEWVRIRIDFNEAEVETR